MSASGKLSNDQYWEQFNVQPSDLDYLVNYLVEQERPYTLAELAYELTRYRHQQMTDLLEDTLSQGRVYRPGEAYALGERVIFPHLSNLVGEVIDVRAGNNPEYEPFSVIQVQVEAGPVRQFAAELPQDHPLNTASYLPDDEVSVEDVFEAHGDSVAEALERALQGSGQFVNVAHNWFVRALLVDISPGQLNIAEAMLDMASGGPLRTAELLGEIDLPDEISDSLQAFSLEYALLRDGRFDEVGPAGYALWYLRDLEPREVRETPRQLQYMPIPYNRQLLDDVMLSLEVQVADEWSDLPITKIPEGRITIVLSYPHWRSGTLPLASHVADLFPTASITDRIRFTFIDDDTGDEFPGWVVRSGRYVFGLEDWYAEKGVAVGSFIDLYEGDEPGRIRVSARSIRSQRREWLRTVSVEGDNMLFEVTRVPVSCEFDELAAVAVSDPDAVDALRDQFNRTSLESLIDRAFSGLAGLSLQRAVHALTLYSVVNLMRRVPPGPMLATLASSSRYNSLGDNYWAYRGESA